MASVLPIIQGNTSILSARNMAFGNLEPLTDGNFVDAKPDFYDGAHPAQIDRRIRTKLGPYITPSTQQHTPALPNFFTEVKGPDGSGAVAKRQACYDGALGARGMHRMAALGDAVFENASTITSTYHSATGTLQLNTTHCMQDQTPEYFMNQLRSFAMTDTAETFRGGASAYRNARDWAKEQRDQLIATANDKIGAETSTLASSGDGVSPSTSEPILESETSIDELSQIVDDSPTLSHKSLKRKRGQHRVKMKSGFKKRIVNS